jgi:hypothetical protein
MTQARKCGILLAAVILTARKLQRLLDEVEREGKPNMAITFWSEVYIKNAIERANALRIFWIRSTRSGQPVGNRSKQVPV